MQLGAFGVFLGARGLDGEAVAQAARVAESAGFGALWLGGSPRLSVVRPALAASERLVVATGIVNVWDYDPAELAGEYAEITDEHGDRVVVGIGIGHREATDRYEKPIATMRGFLDGIDAAERPIPADRRVLAALGPRMLALSAERAGGAHPYFVPREHVVVARDAVGPDKLVAAELSVAIDDDPERGRAAAEGFARFYLGLDNYVSNLLRLGFSEQDVAGDGSAALLDRVVPQGDAARIAAVARDFRAAGADHVAVQVVGAAGVPEAQWRALSSALGLG